MRNWILIILINFPLLAFSQIWQETFSGLANGAILDNGSTKWTTVQPTGPEKLFAKMSFPGFDILAIDNTGDEGTWISQSIDISASPEVAIGITLGSYWASATDYIRCYYKVDNGPEVLFGEQFGAADLNIASAASAIVSGNSLQIIIKGKENTPGLYNSIPRIMGVDDVTVSSITYLYARQSGNWDSTNSWSLSGYNGTSCECTPNLNTHAFVGENRTVTINTTARSAGVTVENSGRINYAANARLNIERGGVLDVKDNGSIDKNGNNSSSIGFSTYSSRIGIHGNVDIGDLVLNNANVTFEGSGSITIGRNLNIIGLIGKSIFNNVAGNFTIVNELRFDATSSNATFINSGAMLVNNRVVFDNDDILLINDGILSIGTSGIFVAHLDDDGNIVENNGVLNLGNIVANNSDFTLNNRGVVNQSGSFTNFNSGSFLNNLEGGIWNYSGTGIVPRLYTNAPSNVFNYTRAGNQTISVPEGGFYQNLTLSGSGIKTLGANVATEGDLLIADGARLDVGTDSYSLTLKGDWKVESSHSIPFVARAGKVTFEGPADAVLSSNKGMEAFYNLEVNKAGSKLSLSSESETHLLVSNSLNLTEGSLDLNGMSLTIANPDPNALSRSAGFIKSEISSAPYSRVKWNIGNVTGTYVFPFGKSSTHEDYIPFTFNITEPGTGNGIISLATYGTGFDNTPFPQGVANLGGTAGGNLSLNVVDRFWQIDLEGFSENPVSDITFTAAASETVGIGNFVAQRWNVQSQSWDPPLPGQLKSGSGSVTVPNVSTFSPWTMVDMDTPLPVALSYFKAHSYNGNVVLDWETTSEKDNSYFTIEKSQDLRTFHVVKKIKGRGSKNSINYYQTVDENPFPRTSYYRLKQTDFDGSIKYFNPIMIQMAGAINVHVFPNPTNGYEMTIIWEKGNLLDYSIPLEIVNSNGQVVFSRALTALEKQENKLIVIFDHKLSSGIYILKIGTDFRQKLMVN